MKAQKAEIQEPKPNSNVFSIANIQEDPFSDLSSDPLAYSSVRLFFTSLIEATIDSKQKLNQR